MPKSAAIRLVDAELVERLEHVEVALARGDDAEPRLAAAGEHQPVGHVDPEEGERRRNLVFVEPLLLRHGVSPGRMLRPPGGIRNAPGMTLAIRSSEPSMVAVDSTVSLTHLSPTQSPAKRDSAKPISP